MTKKQYDTNNTLVRKDVTYNFADSYVGSKATHAANNTIAAWYSWLID